jgi:hypothetical protein
VGMRQARLVRDRMVEPLCARGRSESQEMNIFKKNTVFLNFEYDFKFFNDELEYKV